MESTNFIQDQVVLLSKEVDAEQILQNLRAHYNSDISYYKSISNTRREYLKTGVPHQNYKNQVDECYSIVNNIESFDENIDKEKLVSVLDTFFSSSLSHQYDNKKKIINIISDTCFTPLLTAFKNVQILPNNVESLCLSEKEVTDVRNHKATSLIRKNMCMIELHDSFDFFHKQVHILQYGSKSKSEEIFALLSFSRRE